MHVIVSLYDIDNRADRMTLWFICNVFNIRIYFIFNRHEAYMYVDALKHCQCRCGTNSRIVQLLHLKSSLKLNETN